jgi:hypothetical protein
MKNQNQNPKKDYSLAQEARDVLRTRQVEVSRTRIDAKSKRKLTLSIDIHPLEIEECILQLKSLHYQVTEVRFTKRSCIITTHKNLYRLRRPRKKCEQVVSIYNKCTRPLRISDSISIQKFASTSLGKVLTVVSICKNIIKVQLEGSKKVIGLPKSILEGEIILLETN